MSEQKLPGYVTLQQVVYNYLNDINNYSKENYKRLFQWAIRGYTDLNLYHLDTISVAYLTPNIDTGVCNLPDDFVRYVKIGYNDNGTIKVLGLNNELALVRDESCGEVSNPDYGTSTDEANTDLAVPFVPHFYGDTYVPALYGLNGGYAEAYYRIDKERRLLIISNAVTGSEIILEYVSSGVSLSGATFIPREALEPLIAFLHWQDAKFNPKLTRGDRQDAKQDYHEAVNKMRFLVHKPTKEEFLDAIYSGFTGGLSR
jgi:hypothetical protein